MVALSNLSKLARDGTEDKRWKMITNIFDSHGQRGLELDSINLSSELLKFAMKDERRKVEESYNRAVSIRSTEPRNHRIIIAGFTNIIKHKYNQTHSESKSENLSNI